ncbi:unnamed protein product [Discosporangium mesarthrocarpum]
MQIIQQVTRGKECAVVRKKKLARNRGSYWRRDRMSLLSPDIVIGSVLSFTSHKDLCRLQTVSRVFRDAARTDSIWRALVLSEGLLVEEEIVPAMLSLGLANHRQLFEALVRIGLPNGVVGYWRADFRKHSQAPPNDLVENFEARGELLRIYVTVGGILCESILAHGTRRGVFRVKITPPRNGQGSLGIVVFPLEDEFLIGGLSSPPGVEPAQPTTSDQSTHADTRSSQSDSSKRTRNVCIKRDGDGFILSRGSTTGRYSKLHQNQFQGTGNTDQSDYPQGMCGLWTGTYGSHGLEVVHVALGLADSALRAMFLDNAQVDARVAPTVTRGGPTEDGDNWDTSSTLSGATSTSVDSTGSNGEENIGGDGAGTGARTVAVLGAAPLSPRAAVSTSTFLYGTKVIGDRNVPAGKCSFMVDLSRAYDPQEELANDMRPAMLLSSGAANITDLGARLPLIERWHRGWGQINREPRVWSPELVDVEFIVYRAGSGQVEFSVMWSEPLMVVRMVVDFKRVRGCEGQWPRWGGGC